jgi:hypothetical protein
MGIGWEMTVLCSSRELNEPCIHNSKCRDTLLETSAGYSAIRGREGSGINFDYKLLMDSYLQFPTLNLLIFPSSHWYYGLRRTLKV